MSIETPEMGKWTENDFAGPEVIVTVQIAEGHELPPDALAALESLSRAIAAGDEVVGFGLGSPSSMLMSDTSQNILGIPSLGPIVICGCKGGNECSCKRNKSAVGIEEIQF